APLSFTTMGMGIGALGLIILSGLRADFAPVAAFGAAQWLASLYLGIFGAAFIFFLWAYALGRTSPTRVAISVTVNPVTASLVGAVLLGEPLRWNLIAGIVNVFVGIWVATMS
ncbi:MAG: DMT family transporter, partial [Rhizobiaceae bacterium]|nr:DMT family transporter [Rhizobiaceae bacterium]